ncbi:YHYH protein [Candidatus Gracilibacteria bacterium]|nr:YHYH protein [Candidatus Gracilibacteria bacterium]
MKTLVFLGFLLAFMSCSTDSGVTQSENANELGNTDISQQDSVTELTEPEEIVSQNSQSVDINQELHSFRVEAWADNWFSMYNNGELVVEDSVSINTERSFNSESQSFISSYPLELAFILKDFKEDDSGLEYIGERNQQMGDGGFIMQITDQDSGELVAVSNSDMKCLVIHEAPLNTSCETSEDTSTCGFESREEPDDWKLASFDDSLWDNATVHTSASVSPKDGYNDINWDSRAEFIWGPNLETDNTILCKLVVEDPNTNNISQTSDAESDVFSYFPNVSVSSDTTYMYLSHETGIPDHEMMVGITNWQQQVPIDQDYTGNNSWSIPLNPQFSDNNLSTTENSFRGAIAVAVNGIPIFTALNNRGEDALAIGELDEFGGHSGRADDYHYHLPPVHLEKIVGEGQPIAFAFDGFPIYGETDEDLDEHFGTLSSDGRYQYHTVLDTAPYFIPTFKGEVNYNGDEISPQAQTSGVRPATEPLRGDLKITHFEALSDTSYSLKYEYESQTYTVDYSWDDAGEYTYIFTDPNGESRIEKHTRR